MKRSLQLLTPNGTSQIRKGVAGVAAPSASRARNLTGRRPPLAKVTECTEAAGEATEAAGGPTLGPCDDVAAATAAPTTTANARSLSFRGRGGAVSPLSSIAAIVVANRILKCVRDAPLLFALAPFITLANGQQAGGTTRPHPHQPPAAL